MGWKTAVLPDAWSRKQSLGVKSGFTPNRYILYRECASSLCMCASSKRARERDGILTSHRRARGVAKFWSWESAGEKIVPGWADNVFVYYFQCAWSTATLSWGVSSLCRVATHACVLCYTVREMPRGANELERLHCGNESNCTNKSLLIKSRSGVVPLMSLSFALRQL